MGPFIFKWAQCGLCRNSAQVRAAKPDDDTPALKSGKMSHSHQNWLFIQSRKQVAEFHVKKLLELYPDYKESTKESKWGKLEIDWKVEFVLHYMNDCKVSLHQVIMMILIMLIMTIMMFMMTMMMFMMMIITLIMTGSRLRFQLVFGATAVEKEGRQADKQG